MVYRRTERVEERLQDKRDRILQAVRKVVGEVGFRGAQVTMVAAAAGVATGTVYRYFPSKGELFAEALALNAQHEVRVVAAVAEVKGPASSRLANAVSVFAEPEVDAARLIYRRAFAAVFEKLIREGMRHGDFPVQNAAASAACVMGALSEGLIGPLAPEAPDLADTCALIDAIIGFCLQAVSAAPHAHSSRVG